MRWMKESALGRIRTISMNECVAVQFQLRELVAITTIADVNLDGPFLVCENRSSLSTDTARFV
jgi:hypothetical protein